VTSGSTHGREHPPVLYPDACLAARGASPRRSPRGALVGRSSRQPLAVVAKEGRWRFRPRARRQITHLDLAASPTRGVSTVSRRHQPQPIASSASGVTASGCRREPANGEMRHRSARASTSCASGRGCPELRALRRLPGARRRIGHLLAHPRAGVAHHERDRKGWSPAGSVRQHPTPGGRVVDDTDRIAPKLRGACWHNHWICDRAEYSPSGTAG
jgi:hypothetical protein